MNTTDYQNSSRSKARVNQNVISMATARKIIGFKYRLFDFFQSKIYVINTGYIWLLVFVIK